RRGLRTMMVRQGSELLARGGGDESDHARAISDRQHRAVRAEYCSLDPGQRRGFRNHPREPPTPDLPQAAFVTNRREPPAVRAKGADATTVEKRPDNLAALAVGHTNTTG